MKNESLNERKYKFSIFSFSIKLAGRTSKMSGSVSVVAFEGELNAIVKEVSFENIFFNHILCMLYF